MSRCYGTLEQTCSRDPAIAWPFSYRQAVRRAEFDLSQLVRDDLQPHHQQQGRTALLDHNVGARHARALVDDVLAKAAQARHRLDQADFCERLLDGIFGDPQRAGYGSFAHVVRARTLVLVPGSLSA